MSDVLLPSTMSGDAVHRLTSHTSVNETSDMEKRCQTFSGCLRCLTAHFTRPPILRVFYVRRAVWRNGGPSDISLHKTPAAKSRHPSTRSPLKNRDSLAQGEQRAAGNREITKSKNLQMKSLSATHSCFPQISQITVESSLCELCVKFLLCALCGNAFLMFYSRS